MPDTEPKETVLLFLFSLPLLFFSTPDVLQKNENKSRIKIQKLKMNQKINKKMNQKRKVKKLVKIK